jgi:hypothetical protein
MAVLKSTGFITYVNGTGSVKAALDLGFIRFYNGTPPANADAAVTGTRLWTVSVDGDGTGLTYEINSAGRAAKPSAAQWSGATTAGTPTYWRASDPDDDPDVLSTVHRRIQGTCGNNINDDLYLDNPVLVTDGADDAKLLNVFTVGI